MIGRSLADLDELALHCRDVHARSYIAEAVACYKAGAFRACVVATWTAVVFDLLGKLRDLELAGSSGAKTLLEKFDRDRIDGNIQSSLAFEREILGVAKDQFALFSLVEYDDLIRLREDRHRCAHPSMQSSGEPFEATAELARYHVRNAISHLLAQPPVQGKIALDRIWSDIRSEYFPVDPKDATEALRSGPLGRARPALVRSVVIGLTKVLLVETEEREDVARRRLFAALLAVVGLHRETAESVLRDDLPKILDRVEDQDLRRAIEYVHRIPNGWDALTESVRMKLRQYVLACPSGDAANVVLHALHVPTLADAARSRMHDLPDFELAQLLDRDSDVGVVQAILVERQA